MSLQKIGFIGLGLIGGSIAKKLHALHPELTMIATAHHAETVAEAYKEHLIINNTPCELKDFADCDYIFLCTPTKKNIEYLQQLKDVISPDCIITDVGSVKTEIHREVIRLGLEANFIGGHPMAGREFSGLDYSLPTLFDGASMIFVPTKSSTERVLEQLEAYFMSLGFGQTVRCTAQQHDHMIAFTSQLAHVVSSAYIKSPEADKHNGYSAGSYKDLTRVAKLNETMWSELFLCNAEPLAEEIDEVIKHLDEYRKAIRAGDREELTILLRDGRERKERLG